MKRLIGVGVGPGDPELVTVKAVRVLREADVVLVPVLACPDQEPGRAETIIRGYVDADKIKRLEFALNDTGGVTPRRAAAWRAAATTVAAEFADGASTVAFGTLGDPNLYSTFSYLAQTVRDLVPGVDVQTMAGITAMQDLASRAGISLAEGTEPVTLVPLNSGTAVLEAALASGGTVVGYKVGATASPAPQTLRDRLHQAGRLRGCRDRRPSRPPRRSHRTRRRVPDRPVARHPETRSRARSRARARARSRSRSRARSRARARSRSRSRRRPYLRAKEHSRHSVFVHPYHPRAPPQPRLLPGPRPVRA